MPRFVILRHELPASSAWASHWDLMLEEGGVLRTWAIEEEPTPGRELTAAALADHRVAYLDYEGPISGDRGHVTRWDAGDYTVEEETPDLLKIGLAGARLNGPVTLRRLAGQRWGVTF